MTGAAWPPDFGGLGEAVFDPRREERCAGHAPPALAAQFPGAHPGPAAASLLQESEVVGEEELDSGSHSLGSEQRPSWKPPQESGVPVVQASGSPGEAWTHTAGPAGAPRL